MPLEIPEIEGSIRHYEEVIQSFEQASARLRARRDGATDGAAVHIDRLLNLNERTLESLNRILASAREQLARVKTQETADGTVTALRNARTPMQEFGESPVR